MKRNVIGVCVLCIIIIFIGTGCINKAANYEPTFKDVVLKTDSTDAKEISNEIMTKYLDEYEKDTVAKELRITDYTINKINDIQGNADKFSFLADYSIKPSDMNLYCLAGNGVIKDQWVANKIVFIDVQKENNEYKIINIGTGKLTLEQIKQSYAKTDEKIINIQEYKNYVLVESQAAAAANHFALYNLKTGSKSILPNGINFIDSAKIFDENKIILYSKGTNSESAWQEFPYEIDCIRCTENNNQDLDFTTVNKEIKFPIDKQIHLNGKEKEEITDVRVTVNGFQVCFGSQNGSEIEFNADFVDCPSTSISYDNINGELYLKFKDTKIAKPLLKVDQIYQNNTYIKSINIKQDNNTVMIRISLNDTAKYYTGKKSSIYVYDRTKNNQKYINIPYMDIEFFNNNTF